jgi:hypothetical protein
MLTWALRFLIITDLEFYGVIIASIFGAIGQPFLLNAAPQISSNWFGVNEVSFVLNLMK